MNLISFLSKKISDCCKKLFSIENPEFDLEFAKDRLRGDFSLSAAFSLAKILKKNPKQIADQICQTLKSNSSFIEKCEVAGGGFVNIWLKKAFWKDFLLSVNSHKESFGFDADIGKKEIVNVEFVSANPTGPLHLGHLRGAVIFDTLSELLKKLNFSVQKEYYINDAGKQIEILMESIFLRFKELIKGQSCNEFPDYCYPGEYIKEIALKIKEKHEKEILNYSKEEFCVQLKDLCVELIMDLIRSDLKELNIEYNSFVKESYLHKNHYVEKSIEILSKKELIDELELEKPKGVSKSWQKRSQMVFLSKKFGDDQDRSLQKADGGWTYFASDLAYHLFKIERGFKKMIVGLGADHAGYVKRLKGIVNALSNGNAEIDIRLYNIVNLIENGKQVKFSKRKGNTLGLSDLKEKGITCQELRFAMLTNGAECVLDFDAEKFLENSENNPIFYVQYASARCNSVLKKYNGCCVPEDVSTDLFTEKEWDLIKVFAKWPVIVEAIARTYHIHKIVFYAKELAEKFHSLWSAGIKNPDLRFIIDSDARLTNNRVFLAKITSYVIASIFSLLKIVPAKNM